MRFYKSEFFYPIIGIIASIFFCTIIWDHIVLAYSNPHEIVGEYSINSYNSFNDTLRYIIFIYWKEIKKKNILQDFQHLLMDLNGL